MKRGPREKINILPSRISDHLLFPGRTTCQQLSRSVFRRTNRRYEVPAEKLRVAREIANCCVSEGGGRSAVAEEVDGFSGLECGNGDE
jgi:hypothetical protein